MPDRHARQERFTRIGATGQARLRGSRVVVVGVGALGSAAAEMLVRAGVGRVRLIDRDVVEWTNLQRQALYDSADAEASRPKVEAAARRLRAIDPAVDLEPIAGELNARSAATLIAGCDLVLDGLDGFPARHLLNEACCRAGIPWIYAACVGAYACGLAILPGETPCLRCLQEELPAAADSPTCDSAGIIAPAVQLAAAWQVGEALKLLVGDRTAMRRELWGCDLWANRWTRLRLDGARRPDCAACGSQPTYPALSATVDPAVVLCGRQAVQVRHPAIIDPAALAGRIPGATASELFARWRDGDATLTAFADGRVLVQGVGDPVRARSLVDRWLG